MGNKTEENILLGHGSGGKLTHQLIRDLFLKNFNNPILNDLTDAAVFKIGKLKFCLTSDSFVVRPIFFPGADIGSLSVYGTVNDLAVMGAKPVYLSLALIITAGFKKENLLKITKSIARAAKKAGVKIITGDTKVIEGKDSDEIFINTTGLGVIAGNYQFSKEKIKPGDKIILSGTIADHGIAVLAARGELNFQTNLKSDAAALNQLTQGLFKYFKQIKFMRDPTRGGLATTLNEIVEGMNFGIIVKEESLPVKKSVHAACDFLGLDPLYIGNEGKLVLVAQAPEAKKILSLIKRHKLGRNARIIGEISKHYKGRVILETAAGGERILEMLSAEPIPRIC